MIGPPVDGLEQARQGPPQAGLRHRHSDADLSFA